jgi:hypothetical protein
MAVERLMAVEIGRQRGLRGQRHRLTAYSRTVLLRDPRLQAMVVMIRGDQKHQRISILRLATTIGVRISQRLAGGVEIPMMHPLLERICQPLHLRL